MTINDVCNAIVALDEFAMTRCRAAWDQVAMPLESLGKLQKLIIQIAGITGHAIPELSQKAVAAFCADNGVVTEGVTQSGQEVTAIVARGFAEGTTPVCRMAQCVGARVIPIDVGMVSVVEHSAVIQVAIRRGTGNICCESAMSRAEAERAILTGVSIVQQLSEQGYHLIAAGEMGIGNTTTSSAVTAALLHLPAAVVAGRGAGLSSSGLAKKIEVIEAALALHQPDSNDCIDVLSKVGGLDIAALCGLFLGGALYRIPVIIDGYISAVAALCAVRLCPATQPYLIASHRSSEPAAAAVLEALRLSPVLDAGMHLGEGTGAVALMPLLDMTLAVLRGTPSFAERQMDAYQVLL